jgi:microcystin-dependent protein
MEPFLGQIQAFGFNFAPRGWAFCDGQLLPISSNTALFSLLGTTYGGDGRSTFALPDLRGRSIVHPGTGPGLSPIRQGDRGGAESVTLNIANLPSHNHTATVAVNTGGGEDSNPTQFIASHASAFSEEATAGKFLSGVAVGNNGGSQAFNTRNPYLGVYMSIALQGVFPSRS